ncbi:MAG TPA: hypothetical protein QF764_16355 [Planctomycetota bacterium]|nr:hypothetical protein [Planctomycetota bacterium]
MDALREIASELMLEDLRENAGPWIGASMEEHARALLEVLEVADLQIAGSPYGARLRQMREPMAPEDESLWLSLVRARRSRSQRAG